MIKVKLIKESMRILAKLFDLLLDFVELRFLVDFLIAVENGLKIFEFASIQREINNFIKELLFYSFSLDNLAILVKLKEFDFPFF